MDTAIIKLIAAAALVLSGTIAGYLTNKYAVRWLFKPVTLFGKRLFDVSILSTDENQRHFIESMADCVEGRILTKEALTEALKADTIRLKLNKLTGEFMEVALPEKIRSMKAGELRGFEETRGLLRLFLREAVEENTYRILHTALKEVKISSYLTDVQISRAVDVVYAELRAGIKSNYAMGDALKRIIPELVLTSMFNSDGRAALKILASKFFSGEKENPAAFGAMNAGGLSLPEKIRDSVKKILIRAVSDKFRDYTYADLLSEKTIRKLAEASSGVIIEKAEEKLDALSEEECYALLSDLSRGLGGRKQLVSDISDFLYDRIEGKIDELLEGKVKETVKNALGRLNPEQLCAQAESLMADQLAYLSYFGAVIGFFLSIPALFFTLGQITVSGFPGTLPVLAGLIILMAGIGVLTNVIAIQLFFHPYREKKWLARNKTTELFSKGLIIRHQSQLAAALGDYIGGQLVTSENIVATLKKTEGSLAEALYDKTVPEVSVWMKSSENLELLSDKLTKALINELMSSRISIIGRILSYIGAENLEKFINLNNPDTRAWMEDMYFSLLNNLADGSPAAGGEGAGEASDEDAEAGEFRFAVKALAGMIRGSSGLTENVKEFLETFIVNVLGKKGAGDFVSMKEIGDSLDLTVQQLAESPEMRGCIAAIVKEVAVRQAASSQPVISREMTEDMLRSSVQTACSFVLESVPEILRDVHVDELVVRQVNALEPEEIKALIYSFGAPAIRRLYALGSIGAVFGINTYLAFLIFLVDKITSEAKTK